MTSAHEFLVALTVVLGVAAVTTLVFHRLRQPVVLGYLLAGLIVGPHTPIPLVADKAVVHTLSELGVILLMFSLGLEFSIRKLIRAAPTAGIVALIQCSLMVWLGGLAGRLLGWTDLEGLFAGAIVAISSTTIIAKAFDEQRISGRLRDLVVSILIVEDLIAVVLMALLTAISSGAGLSIGDLALTLADLAGFLLGVIVVGLLVVPRLVRSIVRRGNDEVIIVASVGLCFGLALLAQEFGHSIALGAFLGGSLVAESGQAEPIEHLLRPIRDIFAAVFFVSVGMAFDPALVAEHWGAVLTFTLVVVLGKIGSVTVGAFLVGAGTRTAVAAGMSLAQIGEFSFIIAILGADLGATGSHVYPVAVAVSALTTLTTPWLVRASGPVATWVDRKLPKPLQTFATLYGSWLDQLRRAPRRDTQWRRLRRWAGLLLLDMLALVGLTAAVSISIDAIAGALTREIGLDGSIARAFVIGAAILLSIPFWLGLLRIARQVGVTLAEIALPPNGSPLNLGQAPRQVLSITLQLLCLLGALLPIVALTQPFVPGLPGLVLLLAVALSLGVAFWRSATDLHGHVRAGAEVVLEAISSQAAAGDDPVKAPEESALHEIERLLPGIGALATLRLTADNVVVGRTLSDLDVRGLTGATVLAIERVEGSVSFPTAQEVLRNGDLVVLAGTERAVTAAKQLLSVGRQSPPQDGTPPFHSPNAGGLL